MKRKIDRSAVMKRAHQIRKQSGLPWSDCLRMSWAAERAPRSVIAVKPQSLPLEAVVLGSTALVRRLMNKRIRAGVRVRLDVGLAIDDQSYTRSFDATALVAHQRGEVEGAVVVR